MLLKNYVTFYMKENKFNNIKMNNLFKTEL